MAKRASKKAQSEEAKPSNGKDHDDDTGKNSNGGGKQETGRDGLALLRGRRDRVRGFFDQLEEFDGSKEQVLALRNLAKTWLNLVVVEDEVAFPFFLEADVDEALIVEADIERDLVAFLLSDLWTRSPSDKIFPMEVKTLCHHLRRVLDAEDQSTGIYGKAGAAKLDAEALADALKDRFANGESHAEVGGFEPLPKYLRNMGRMPPPQESKPMRGNYRERDDQGRFLPEDDDRERHYRSSRSQSRGGRYEDDDRPGWRGDSRGHAEAARRGWETRRSHEYDDDRRYSQSRDRDMYRGRSMDMDDDRRSYRGRSGYDDDYRQGHGGWFGDSEGHSRAARRGWDNPDHGQSGWFGDTEGHSRAAQRGWDNPDHGQSGWFGDSEGHSEASRRGWEGRRREDDDYYDRRRSRRRYD